MEVSGQFLSSRFTPGEKASDTHWIGDWVDSKAGLGDLERTKISCPCRTVGRNVTLHLRKSNPPFLGRPSRDYTVTFANVKYNVGTIKVSLLDSLLTMLWRFQIATYILKHSAEMRTKELQIK
jgi:hypothetical protein